MKKKLVKVLIPVCVAMVIVIGVCVALFGGGSSKTEDSEDRKDREDTETVFEKDPDATYLTRGEWISVLARLAGMTDSDTSEAYFADVNETDELYPYVQSAADWGMFEDLGGEFEADADASREFVIATAVIAADVMEDYGYIEKDEDAKYKTCIQFARDNGNIEQTDKAFLAEPVTIEEGQAVLEWVKFVYENPYVEESEEVVLHKDVVDFRNERTDIIVEENMVTFTSKVASSLQKGDVFLLPPTEDYPVAIARKVVAIGKDARGNTTVETQTPELSEIFETLSIEQMVSLEDAQIQLYEGFTYADVDTTTQASKEYQLLTSRGGGGGGGHGKYKHNPEGDFLTKRIENERFDGEDIHLAVKWTAKDGVIIKEEKLPSGWETNITDPFNKQQAEDVNKLLEGTNYILEGGSIEDMVLAKRKDYEENNLTIAGTLDVTNIYAIVDLNIKKGDLKYADVTLNYDADLAVEIEGEYRNEIPVAKVIFPVAGVCAVEGTMYLYVDAEGKLAVGFYTGATGTLSYSERHGSAFRAVDREKKVPEIKLELTAEAGLGMSVGVTVVSVDVLKMGLDIGAQLKYTPAITTDIHTTVENDVMIQTDILYLDLYGTLAYPVVTRYAEFDIVFVKGENKVQLRGPEGTWLKEEPAVLLDERYELLRTVKHLDTEGNEMYDDFQSKFEEFVLAPENANMSFENLYSIDGARAFVNKIGIEAGNAYNILGTRVYYSEDPRYYTDGRVEEGATLTFSGLEEDENGKRSFSSLEYTGTELSQITTHILHVDETIPEKIEGVSGFSNYLRSNHCLSVKDLLQTWDLSSEYISAAEAKEATYSGEMETEKFGVVKIAVESDVAMVGDLYSKTIEISFAKDSGSPYESIYVTEGFPANYWGEIKTLRITAYAWENE